MADNVEPMLADMAGHFSIVVFDSGIGGLTILHSILNRLPMSSILYFADSLYFPYGSKEPRFVRERTEQVVSYLQAHYSVGLYVLACNTATTDAIVSLRTAFPDVPFIGTEPAVSVAKRITRNGKIGVIATSGTIKTDRYHQLVEYCAADQTCSIFSRACPGLAMLIQRTTPHYQESIHLLLEQNLSPLLEEGIDVLVLGCTHYSIIKKDIQAFVGPNVQVIDSQDAIANRCFQMIQERVIPIRSQRDIRFLSSDHLVVPQHISALYQDLELCFEECSLPRLSLE